MEVELLPSTIGEPVTKQFCITSTVNESITIDVSTPGLSWLAQRQTLQPEVTVAAFAAIR